MVGTKGEVPATAQDLERAKQIEGERQEEELEKPKALGAEAYAAMK